MHGRIVLRTLKNGNVVSNDETVADNEQHPNWFSDNLGDILEFIGLGVGSMFDPDLAGAAEEKAKELFEDATNGASDGKTFGVADTRQLIQSVDYDQITVSFVAESEDTLKPATCTAISVPPAAKPGSLGAVFENPKLFHTDYSLDANSLPSGTYFFSFGAQDSGTFYDVAVICSLTLTYVASHKPYLSFESHNYPGKFVRHAFGLGEISPISIGDSLDAKDSTFALNPGLADAKLASFESFNYPGSYLRHQEGRVKLDKYANDPLYMADATFKIIPGLADSSAVSFESYNFPGNYLRHRDGHLYVETSDGSSLSKKDATFRIVAPRATF